MPAVAAAEPGAKKLEDDSSPVPPADALTFAVTATVRASQPDCAFATLSLCLSVRHVLSSN